MNFVTQISGYKTIDIKLAGCSKNSICPAVLNHLIKDLEGSRALNLDYISSSEVHYKTQIKSILLSKPNALNCFHKGHVHVRQSNDKITIAYNLFNYYWFIAPSSILLILFTLAMLLETQQINVIIGFIFLVIVGFPMAYMIFFVIPLLAWRYKLNKLDFKNYLQEIIHESEII